MPAPLRPTLTPALAAWPPQMLARAMTRKGNALQKKGDLEGAVAAYSKACGAMSTSRACTACAD
jgi:predicted negative regulator of RcsB-dependent stress response